MDDSIKRRIQELRSTKRNIDKELETLSSSLQDADKLAEWKMIYEVKQKVSTSLRKQGVSWKKFLETPDWFEYAYYKQTGGVKRLVTSITLPPPSDTNTDEATMIKLAAEQRTKIVRRKKRKTTKKTDTDSAESGKSEAQKTGGVI